MLPNPSDFFNESVSATHPTNNLSPFFTLSRELRDIIYHHTWNGQHIHYVIEGCCTFYVRYGDEVDWYFDSVKWEDSYGLPIWLLTCRQFLDEGVEQFYRGATCEHSDNQFSSELIRDGVRLISLYRIKNLHIEPKDWSLLFETVVDFDEEGWLCVARECGDDWKVVDLQGHERWFDPDVVGDPHGTWAIVRPDYRTLCGIRYSHPELSMAIEHLKLRAHCLKNLEIGFRAPFESTPNTLFTQLSRREMIGQKISGWHVDLSYLKNLGTNFDRIKFTLGIPRGDRNHLPMYEKDRLYVEVFKMIQEQMEKVAKYLVGGESGGAWLLKDWVGDCRGGGREWHLEVTRARGGTSNGSVSYKGLGSFVLIRNFG